MDFENINIWCILIPILIGLLCGLFGYWIGKSGPNTVDNSEEIKSLKARNSKLEADLNACRQKLPTATSASGDSDTAIISALAFDAGAAKAAFGKQVKQDDLKVVEGIGPKIAGMFKDAGIGTWEALADCSVSRCQEVLNGGGKRYKVHDPASWPMQARMAYEGKWKELAKWQNKHLHGKL